jgi:choline dehydrogenase-like flavoprotein
MCHNNSALLAVSKEPNPTVFQKTLGVNDFYYGAPDFDFPLGHFQMLGKSEADELRGDAPKFAPQFTLELMASHSLDFWLTSEDLPSPDNRVSLDEDGSIRLSYTPNNLEGHHRLIGKLKSMAEHFGVHDTFFDRSAYLGKKIPIAGCAHQNGTCRFGTDPYSSVLDTNCKTHEIDNLYVVDGSFFVSSTAVNPALTIMANALRVGDHLLDRLK